MTVWTEETIARLRSQFVGTEDDFGKLLTHLAVVWSIADLEKLERSDRQVTWDDYFARERVFTSMSKSTGGGPAK